MDAPFPAEELERLFPQLEVYELIGKGGMGAVYRARHRSLDRQVALKLLPPELEREPGFSSRFLREAQAMARLDHPHIVRVFDHGQAEGQHYLVLEYVDGLNLRQLMRRRELSTAEALALVPQICDALQYAHDQGVVHRDVKPENILVNLDGKVKIADFGLARMTHAEGGLSSTLTGTHQVMGTPHYMAPEQVEGFRDVDHRADIYSLGIVFYEMLTGELPLGRFEPPSQRAALDVRLDEVVLRALEKQPERRYQRAEEVKTAVRSLEHDVSGGNAAAGQAAAVAVGAASSDDPKANEAMLWAMLCIALPPLAYLGVVGTGTWWPLCVLFLPAFGLGSALPGPVLDTSGQIFVVLVGVFSALALISSMHALDDATPLLALAPFSWGFAWGKLHKEKKLGAASSQQLQGEPRSGDSV